jgi:hypothetical protein
LRQSANDIHQQEGSAREFCMKTGLSLSLFADSQFGKQWFDPLVEVNRLRIEIRVKINELRGMSHAIMMSILFFAFVFVFLLSFMRIGSHNLNLYFFSG